MREQINADAWDAFADNVGSLWACSNIPEYSGWNNDIICNNDENDNDDDGGGGDDDSQPQQQRLTPLAFSRDHVGASWPCQIRIAAADSFLPRWTVNDIVHVVGHDAEIRVDVTPDGHGDCLRRTQSGDTSVDDDDETSRKEAAKHSTTSQKEEDQKLWFVKPQEQLMTIAEFRRRLRQPPSNGANDDEFMSSSPSCPQTDTVRNRVFPRRTRILAAATPTGLVENTGVVYFSQQDDCLRKQPALQPLLDHLPLQALPGIQNVLGVDTPDAVNLWMGRQTATSALHQDYYENFFFVASGCKVFTLYPPADVHVFRQPTVPAGRFASLGGNDIEWGVIPDENDDEDDNGWRSQQQVPWIDEAATLLDPRRRMLLHPITIHVPAGNMLYLPTLWFHRVTQTTETVGINYWYDMRFDAKYCYFHLLQNARLEWKDGDES